MDATPREGYAMNRLKSPLKAFSRSAVSDQQLLAPTIPAQFNEWTADANDHADPIELPGVRLRLHFRSPGQLNRWMAPGHRFDAICIDRIHLDPCHKTNDFETR